MSAPLHVFRQNQQTLAAYRQFLRMMPKTVVIYAAKLSMEEVMRPDVRNYTPAGGEDGSQGITKVSGNLMPHDSSNAAWNWRISFGTLESPIMDKDRAPVGHAFEKRSTNDRERAKAVVTERVNRDIKGKLYNNLFKSITAPAKSFSLYNAIDQFSNSKQYVENSNVKAASMKISTYAVTGALNGMAVLKMFERSGVRGLPDAKGLKQYLDGKFRG